MGNLFQKYTVTKTNGEPIDPDAQYFVLRLDTDSAARGAVIEYARRIQAKDENFSKELLRWVNAFIPSRVMADPHYPFPHRTCMAVICDDCREIAEEYAELSARRGLALFAADEQIAELKREVERQTDLAQMWEDNLKIGYPEIMRAWLTDMANKAFKKGQRDMRKELAKIEKARAKIEASLKRFRKTP